MLDMLRRAAARLRGTWVQMAFGAGLLGAFILLADDPIVLREFALSLIRVAAVLWTFEAFIRYSTRRMSEAVGAVPIPEAAPTSTMQRRRQFRFGDLFVKIWLDGSAMPLAVFLVGNLAVRFGLVLVALR